MHYSRISALKESGRAGHSEGDTRLPVWLQKGDEVLFLETFGMKHPGHRPKEPVDDQIAN